MDLSLRSFFFCPLTQEKFRLFLVFTMILMRGKEP